MSLVTDNSDIEMIYGFIEENAREDINKLLLRCHGKTLPYSLDFAVDQIVARRKTYSKLPSFVCFRKFLFPDLISSEQASDERVAEYHAALAGSGKKILDMTAGLGIDAMSMAMRGNNVTACDIDPNKIDALHHNAEVLDIQGIHPYCRDSIDFIRSAGKFDMIFIDPARRDASSRRTYSFSDCTPDVIELLSLMREKADRILIKSSPLLDITQILKEIECTSFIHIVCAKGECKEVLVEISRNEKFGGVRIVDLDDAGIASDISFSYNELKMTGTGIAKLSDFSAGCYLYEPNAGVMKLKIPGALCMRFPGIKHVSHNTSLYVSECLYDDFPGRVLRIDSIPDKRELKAIKGQKYNVVTRNYPVDVCVLRKKIGVKEGDDKFLYAFRAAIYNRPLICLASKVKRVTTE